MNNSLSSIKNGHLLKYIYIYIGNKPSHIITKIQLPIQLVGTHTIHHAQGLTLDCLAFDQIGVTKHS